LNTTALPRLRPSNHWGALGLLVVATVLAASIGAYGSIVAPAFYKSLNQPAWAPPASLFGPVWTVLYTMMCVAAWLVVRALGPSAARPAIALYVVQLAFNALWTWLFFRWQLGALAFVEILLLLALVALTARAFGRARPVAGWMLLPYLAWVAFASVLTFAMWQRNPGVL
jgi:translocator protein